MNNEFKTSYGVSNPNTFSKKATLGFREELKTDIFLNKSKYNYLEIILDHYLDSNSYKEKELEILQNNFTLLPHGLNLSLGSSQGIDIEYLEKVSKLIKKINPPWWSEHIAFTSANGIDIGHLAPLSFNKDYIEVVCKNIALVKKYIEVPLLLENITYTFIPPFSNMKEQDFISEIIEKTNCDLLLDITNLFINSYNHKYSVDGFLDNIPLEKIKQLHFIGGYKIKKLLNHEVQDFFIDSHSEKTPEEVWKIMEKLAKKTNISCAVLEWDENFPNFQSIIEEIDKANFLLNQ